MSAPGWPARLEHGRVGVRPLRVRDAATWVEVRRRNRAWLAPWEGRASTSPVTSWDERHTAGVYVRMVRASRREARAGRTLPLAVTHDGVLVGQITVSTVVRGAFDSASVGYWIDERVAGRGVMSTALALVLDHCFGVVGLHRVQADVRPENAASLAVVRRLGLREEGLHRRYLYIDGAWRDHLSFALLAEDVPGGVLARLSSSR